VGVLNLPPTRKTSEGDLNTYNQQLRTSPLWQGYMAKLGRPADHTLTLSEDERDDFTNFLRANGITVPKGMKVDQAGNFNQKNTLVKNLLKGAAEKLAQGDLQTRVPVNGRDEVAALSTTFNQMAEQLQAADWKQRELESLRRDLIAWVSHDLQTPLTSMRASLAQRGASSGLLPFRAVRRLRRTDATMRVCGALLVRGTRGRTSLKLGQQPARQTLHLAPAQGLHRLGISR